MASASKKTKIIYDLNEAEKHFEQFIKDYDRKYRDEEEKKQRYEIFVKNLIEINEKNANPNETATFGINLFADYRNEEIPRGLGSENTVEKWLLLEMNRTRAATMASTSKETFYDINEAEKHFEQFNKDFDRKYKDEDDKKLYYEVFVKKLVRFNEFYACRNSSFRISTFSDYPEEEKQPISRGHSSVTTRKASASKKIIYDINEAEKHFEQFIKDYDRKYRDEEEKKQRYEIFVKNLIKINEKNANPNETATFGINKFADYRNEEMPLMKCCVGKNE